MPIDPRQALPGTVVTRLIVLLGVVGAVVWVASEFRAQRGQFETVAREQREASAREARKAEELVRRMDALEVSARRERASASEQDARTPEQRVEAWLARQSPEGQGPAAWGPTEEAHARGVASDRTRLLDARVRAAAALLVRRKIEALDDLRTSDDPSDVAVRLGAWTAREPAAARASLATDMRARAGAVYLLRHGASERRTALWLVEVAVGPWLLDVLDAMRAILEEPSGDRRQAEVRTGVCRFLAKCADRASEPQLLRWATHDPDLRSRGWICYHLVSLHAELTRTSSAVVPHETIGSLLDAALAWVGPTGTTRVGPGDRGGDTEAYVVPVMALAAIGAFPHWLEGRRETVRQIASAGVGLESDAARKALLEAGDPWAVERLAGWIPRSLDLAVLLELGERVAPETLDALIIGALGPASRPPGAQRFAGPWPITFRLLDHLRSRAGQWLGFPASLRDKPRIQQVFDPTLRFDGDPHLLAHLETLKSTLPPDLSDAWFRWLATRAGLPPDAIAEASVLRLALDTSSPATLRATLARLLATSAAQRAPHLFPVEYAAYESLARETAQGVRGIVDGAR